MFVGCSVLPFSLPQKTSCLGKPLGLVLLPSQPVRIFANERYLEYVSFEYCSFTSTSHVLVSYLMLAKVS